MNDLVKNPTFWIVISIIIIFFIISRKDDKGKTNGSKIAEKAQRAIEDLNGRRLMINRIVSKYGFSEDLVKGLNQLNMDDLKIVLNGNYPACGGKAPFAGLNLSKCPE